MNEHPRHPRRRAACIVLLAASAALLAGPVARAQQTESVEVRGAVKTTLALRPDDLRAFPADQIGSFTQTRRSDAGESSSSTVRGVRLTALLDRAALQAPDKNDWKSAVVVAIASDGYRVVFSWPELFNSPLGANVLVLFERDGQPLAASEGRIAMISAGDQRTGPRHVRWLRTLDVRLLGP